MMKKNEIYNQRPSRQRQMRPLKPQLLSYPVTNQTEKIFYPEARYVQPQFFHYRYSGRFGARYR